VHGILHVLGYDHEVDAGQMAVHQAEILESLDWVGLVAPPA
jgi:ssRNA-specific RNase YbeY (16S rRNA maturation enzyme)